jgi:hypothetical protein
MLCVNALLCYQDVPPVFEVGHGAVPKEAQGDHLVGYGITSVNVRMKMSSGGSMKVLMRVTVGL